MSHDASRLTTALADSCRLERELGQRGRATGGAYAPVVTSSQAQVRISRGPVCPNWP